MGRGWRRSASASAARRCWTWRDLAQSSRPERFHGVYDARPSGSAKMKPAMLILHGWDDPLDPPEATVALAEELNAHCDDWQILAFGHTGHAFTRRDASAPGMGYSEAATRRGWAALLSLLEEKFAG